VKLIIISIGLFLYAKKLQAYGEGDIKTINFKVHVEEKTEVETEQETVIETEVKTEKVKQEDILILVNQEDIEKFIFYEVPEGVLSENLQKYIYKICEEYGIPQEIVLAMIYRESHYDMNAIGDNGRSFGYMQVMEMWHIDRMERLGVNDLLEPHGNILVAVDYLAELHEMYGDLEKALIAYNCGPVLANEFFQQGINQTSYSEAIILKAEVIRGIKNEEISAVY